MVRVGRVSIWMNRDSWELNKETRETVREERERGFLKGKEKIDASDSRSHKKRRRRRRKKRRKRFNGRVLECVRIK